MNSRQREEVMQTKISIFDYPDSDFPIEFNNYSVKSKIYVNNSEQISSIINSFKNNSTDEVMKKLFDYLNEYITKDSSSEDSSSEDSSSEDSSSEDSSSEDSLDKDIIYEEAYKGYLVATAIISADYNFIFVKLIPISEFAKNKEKFPVLKNLYSKFFVKRMTKFKEFGESM